MVAYKAEVEDADVKSFHLNKSQTLIWSLRVLFVVIDFAFVAAKRSSADFNM